MPQKEHLTFESNTPAFLRRLRGEIPSGPPGSSTDPDRHATPQIRAKRPKDPADQDDEPVYVDAGTGQTLSLGEVNDLKEGNEAKEDKTKEERQDSGDVSKGIEVEERTAANTVMHIGNTRRKREAPVIASGDGNEDTEEKDRGDGATNKHSTSRDNKGKDSKVKKKAKKIKLSFDDD